MRIVAALLDRGGGGEVEHGDIGLEAFGECADLFVQMQAALAGIPVTLAGFALFHHIARRQQLGGTFLTVGYVLWIIVDGLKVGVLLAVLLDAFLDLGRRAKSK